jgi:hypothetical protein
MAFLLGSFTTGLFSGWRNMEDLMATADQMRKQHLSDKLAEKATGQIMSGMQANGSADQSAQPAAAKPVGSQAAGSGAIDTGAAASPPGQVSVENLQIAPSTTPSHGIFRPAPTTAPAYLPVGSAGSADTPAWARAGGGALDLVGPQAATGNGSRRAAPNYQTGGWLGGHIPQPQTGPYGGSGTAALPSVPGGTVAGGTAALPSVPGAPTYPIQAAPNAPAEPTLRALINDPNWAPSVGVAIPDITQGDARLQRLIDGNEP